MDIEMMDIKDIHPYAKNPRRNDDAVQSVANSIRDFGFKQPIVVDKEHIIIVGHTRYKAAKKLKLKQVPVLVADDLTEEQAKAYRIADNSAGSASTWDYDLLMGELQGITIDMGEYGLDTEDMQMETTEPPEVIDDEPPALPKEAGMIDMIMTDPPYNVAIGDKNAMLNKLVPGKGGRHEDNLDNDLMDDAQFTDFLVKAFENMAEYLKDGGAFYIWHASMKSHIFREACDRAGLTVRQFIEWVKNVFVIGMQDYQWKHEPCLYGWKEGAAHYFIPRRDLTTVAEDTLDIDGMTEKQVKEILRTMLENTPADVIHDKKPTASKDHPTMKPVSLIARLIFNSSHRGDTVLDPFGGSGSTMMACEQLGRRCIMMELDPQYCDVIINRWEALTGKKAELVVG